MTLDEKIFAYRATDFIPIIGQITYGSRVDGLANAELKSQGLVPAQCLGQKREGIVKLGYLAGYNMALLLGAAVLHQYMK
jgi:hypothetical protein